MHPSARHDGLCRAPAEMPPTRASHMIAPRVLFNRCIAIRASLQVRPSGNPPELARCPSLCPRVHRRRRRRRSIGAAAAAASVAGLGESGRGLSLKPQSMQFTPVEGLPAQWAPCILSRGKQSRSVPLQTMMAESVIAPENYGVDSLDLCPSRSQTDYTLSFAILD